MSHLLLLLPFFLIPLVAESNNSSYPNCPTRECGDATISYPFWKMDSDTTTQFCGYQGFGIKCSGNGRQNISEITLGGDSYYVQWINHECSSILLADSDVSSVVPGPNNCPRVHHGINLQTLPLNFSILNVNLSFHFNCTGFPSFATEIPCMERSEGKSCVHVMNSSTEETDWDEYSCTDEVVTPVIGEHINGFPNLSTDFGELLRRGFELEWWRVDDCDKCEESGGRCGHHNTTGFVCFCSDGTTSKGDCKGTFVSTVN
ncbi:hypothetical protein L1987_12681 [Smallanthus sonchifolius]|uniref:Uncharacterized protein n=1 Tax=Smallanthus sonchifolius TaxID=185202 RepID=A0ACB9JGJ4_9ASTR|nr:hypothetical protein L1987_12681 [Smallanthus sonchifolius]